MVNDQGLREVDPREEPEYKAALQVMEERLPHAGGPGARNDGGALTVQEFDVRQALIKHVTDEMVEDVHYGVIPGTRDKSLWEAGAEYLRAAFNIAWDYEIIERFEDFEKMEFRYMVKAQQVTRDGRRFGGWEATCWSKEKGFGRMDPAMLPHNVKDRAIKRAFVAMIRNVTGTTGYFKVASHGSQEMEAAPAERPSTSSRREAAPAERPSTSSRRDAAPQADTFWRNV